MEEAANANASATATACANACISATRLKLNQKKYREAFEKAGEAIQLFPNNNDLALLHAETVRKLGKHMCSNTNCSGGGAANLKCSACKVSFSFKNVGLNILIISSRN